MKIKNYEINLEQAVIKINKKGYKKVLLQIPEGLKNYFSNFVEYIEKNTKTSVFISGDPCFGACDVYDYMFEHNDIDFIIQIGHLPIPNLKKINIPTLFLNAKTNLNISTVIEKALSSFTGKKIGVVTTAQHVHNIPDVKKLLNENNFIPIVGKGDKRIFSDGQILGCNFSSASSISKDVDMYIFLGSGTFHPLGLMLSTKKPVITCDPYTNEVKFKELEDLKDMILRQRYGAIARSKDAKIFGILVGTKIGQQRFKEALKIKKLIKSKQKKAFVFMINFFIPSIIEGFRDIDCFISMACPRIAIDDYIQYKIPIITPIELEILFGLREWEDYKFDEISRN